MADYHVGCGITAIFAGTLNNKKDRWINKSDVTDEAFKAVAQYCLEHNEALNFTYNCKRYSLCVVELTPYLPEINVGKIAESEVEE